MRCPVDFAPLLFPAYSTRNRFGLRRFRQILIQGIEALNQNHCAGKSLLDKLEIRLQFVRSAGAPCSADCLIRNLYIVGYQVEDFFIVVREHVRIGIFAGHIIPLSAPIHTAAR